MTTASHMKWHSENQSDPNVMCHPSDDEAWKHFDRMHSEFSQDPRNVRLGLCQIGLVLLVNLGRLTLVGQLS